MSLTITQPPITFINDLTESIQLTAREMDHSIQDAHGLVTEFLWAAKEQSRILEQTKWLSEVVRNSKFAEDPKAQQLCVDVLVCLLNLTVHLLAVITSALPEIFRRASKNKTNWNFGLLKLASDLGEHDLQQQTVGHLYGLAIGLAWKEGWTHPNGVNGWKSIAGCTLAKELVRHAKLDLASLLEHMVENKFAYIWTALRDDFIDEIRHLEKQPREKWLSEHEADNFFDRIPASTYTPEEQQQGRDVQALLRNTARSSDRATAAILEAMADSLPLISGETEAEIRANLAKEVAKCLGISIQQARKKLRKLKESKDKKIQDIKAALQASAKPAEPLAPLPGESED